MACEACGAVHAEATRVLRELREHLGLAERELRGKRSQISRLQGDQVRKLQADPRWNDAAIVLRTWAALCAPRTREVMSDERVKVVLARLKGSNGAPGYTVKQLTEAAHGYAAFPFVVDGQRVAEGPADRRYVSATLVYRSPDHVDRGIALAARIPKLTPEQAYGDLDRRTRMLLGDD